MSKPPSLPRVTAQRFDQLLLELQRCNHQASQLLASHSLPGWCRRSLFYFLGYIARADGRVTEADIANAETLIKRLGLNARQRARAIEQFQQGKRAGRPTAYRGLRARLTHRLWPTPTLLVMFCLCHAAQLHGNPSRGRRYRCEDALDQMGLPLELMEDVIASYARHIWPSRAELQPLPTTLEEACRILGVSSREQLDVKKQAYRRRVSECHPDKLPRNASHHERSLAKERLLRYQKAWDIIRRRERR
ncbi:MAG: molecular chaperone DjlA [Marinobacter sp.]|nr:molecular chaperone DjlA [Marinobacter sp.]